VQGVAIGAALIGVALGAVVLLLLRALMVRAAVDRLGTVEAEVQLFETQLTAARGKLKGVENANADLVKGLIAVRSGSALMRDLQLRAIDLPAAAGDGRLCARIRTVPIRSRKLKAQMAEVFAIAVCRDVLAELQGQLPAHAERA